MSMCRSVDVNATCERNRFELGARVDAARCSASAVRTFVCCEWLRCVGVSEVSRGR